MTIGSKTIGTAPVAGALGVISPARTVATLQQTVAFRAIEPAQRLVTLQQSIARIEPARRLVNIQQRIINATAPKPKVPSAYIWIGGDIKAGIKGTQISRDTALNTVRVTHNEDQSATADIFVFQPINAPINIPSFHGKQLIIETHTDPNDINSEIIPLFTGWVETARHDRARRGIAIQATGLRDERLGREDAGQIQAMTGGMYSNVTQREDATGREYVTELMKTVPGSIGYDRAGDLLYYSWGVAGKPVDLTLTDADVAYDDPTTEFQTRSSVVNSVKIKLEYRYQWLRYFTANVDAYKKRMLRVSGTATCPGYDGKAFNRDQLLQRVDSLSPWELISYTFYPLERFTWTRCGTVKTATIDTIWSIRGREVFCQGIDARLRRRVAQPHREVYEIKLVAPQSVDAYGEEVEGYDAAYSIEAEYDEQYWETDISERYQGYDVTVLRNNEQAKADSRRLDLSNAFNAAVAIGRKQIIYSHRSSYVSAKIHKIQPIDIGDILQHDNRIVKTTGQVVGIEYRIADGLRETEIRTAISYMDTAVTPPNEDFTMPAAPEVINYGRITTTKADYDPEKGAFDISIDNIDEQYTDERELKTGEIEYSVALEVDDITLINGY